jgi:lysophospholipase L1-like esterase
MTSTNQHGFLKRLLPFVLSALLAFAVAEGLSRSLVPPRPPIRFEQDVDKLKQIQMAQFAEIIESDRETFWRLAPNQSLPDDASPFPGLISNSQGLREDHEIPLAKSANEIRILFLGDSCTFGYGFTHTQSFVNRVEVSLRARFPDVSWECVNAGVPGYSLFQGWRYLETRGLELQPDLVVLTFGWNDYGEWDGLSDVEHYAAMQASIPPRALQWSRLCRLLWAAVNTPRSPAARIADRARLSPEEFRSVLGKIDETTTRHGAALTMLVWPMRWNVEQLDEPEKRSTLQFEHYEYARRGVTDSRPAELPAVIDLIPVAQGMAQQHAISEIFIDHGHATSRANEEFANAIVEQLVPWLSSRVSELRDD